MITLKCGDACVGGHIQIAATFGKRFLGLMFRRSLPEGSGLLLMPCGSIHMCFMRTPLDIVYMNGRFHVLAIEKGLKPWRLGAHVKGAKMVLELPEGALERCGIAPGDTLSVHPAAIEVQTEEKRSNNGYERTGKCLES